MKNFALSFLMVAATFQVKAFTPDVYDENPSNNAYVKVLLKQDKKGKMYSGFKACVQGRPETECRQLGHKAFYSIEQLEDEKSSSEWKLVGTSALGAYVVLLGGAGALGVGGVVTGLAMPAMAGSVTTAISGGQVAGALLIGAAGAAGTAKLITMVNAFNPLHHYDNVKTLSDDVITDQKVKTEDIHEFIERLDSVLKDIE